MRFLPPPYLLKSRKILILNYSIFFVYLYQAYYYKVDMKRINEFGQGGEPGEGEMEAVEVDKKVEGKGEVNAIEEKKGSKVKTSGASVGGEKVRRR